MEYKIYREGFLFDRIVGKEKDSLKAVQLAKKYARMEGIGARDLGRYQLTHSGATFYIGKYKVKIK